MIPVASKHVRHRLAEYRHLNHYFYFCCYSSTPSNHHYMAQKILILVNDAPYGTEKAYNAMRLAMQLGKAHPETEVSVFLMADAAFCAIAGQHTPNGYYNIERMMKAVLSKGGKVKICGGCSEARGIKDLQLIEGAEMSTMAEFAQWVVDSDKVVTF